MTKFKIFSWWNHEELERQLNDWVQANPNIRIKRTQLAQSESDRGNSFKISALISYEEDAVKKS